LRRLPVVPLIALLLFACSAPDSTLGVAEAPENNQVASATRFTGLTRLDLGTLGGASSYAADINGGNTVVGWSETASGAAHAFRWTASRGMVDLGTLPGDATSRAVAVLDVDRQGGGEILGVSSDNTGRSTPVVWSASGSIKALPISLIPGLAITLPAGFNGDGEVVGSDAGPFQHGWVWSKHDGKYDLSAHSPGGSSEGSANAINSSGVVVVTTRASTCQHSPECWRTYQWTRNTGYRSLGTPGSDPEATVTGLGLNETGAVAGWVTTNATSPATPYRWARGAGFTLLSHYSPGTNNYGYAAAVNSNGVVVGADRDPASGNIVASTWLSNGAIVKLSPDDPNSSVAVAINNPGTIAGWTAIADGVNHAVIWQPSLPGPHSVLRAPMTVTAVRVTTKSSPCLADPRSIASRQALFACVVKADLKP
jgi:probable HAF family extracellular repeat protein